MAILTDKTFEFTSSSLEQTVRLGVRMGELLAPTDMLCLYGDLGAGKTAFARGVGRGWGSAIRVTSPTYTLINEYPRKRDGLVLYHLDFYRLSESAEIITTGVEDVFEEEAVFMIEWPERIEDFLPAGRLNITFRYFDDTRRSLLFEATDDHATQILKTFRRNAFGIR